MEQKAESDRLEGAFQLGHCPVSRKTGQNVVFADIN